MLVDKNRYVRGVYMGTNPKEVDSLYEDVKILLNDDTIRLSTVSRSHFLILCSRSTARSSSVIL